MLWSIWSAFWHHHGTCKVHANRFLELDKVVKNDFPDVNPKNDRILSTLDREIRDIRFGLNVT
jgi:hypothetical protein